MAFKRYRGVGYKPRSTLGMEAKYSRFEQDNSVSEGEKVYVYWKPEKAVAIKKFEQGAV